MSFPPGTPTVTLVGTIPSAVAGTPFQGRVVLSPSAYLVDSTRNAVYPGGGSVMIANGTISVQILPCDAAGIQPTGWRWRVDIQPSNGGRRVTYWANITGTGTVDIADITPVPAPNGGPSGGSGGAVSSVNGKVGAVVLDASDVHADPEGTAAAAVVAHASATDPHGDRAVAASALAAHEADTTSVHGISNTATLETQSGAQAKADAAQTAAIASAALDATAKVAAHEADTTAVHGIADTALLETAAGATAKVATHAGAADPHGDRADAASKYQAKSAWIFDVTTYGALGNGKVASDAAMTSGSAVLTCSTSAPFTAGDVGKNVMVLGAGTSGETLVGTISAYTDSSHVTLSATAGSTISGVPAMWASDDTVAIQAAIDAAVAYAGTHSGAATVLIPPATNAFYGVAGALRTGGSTLGNAQLTLPVVAATARKLTLTIRGAHTGAGVQHWQQTVPNTTGSTLVSFGLFANATAQANSINAGGNPSVLGGPSQPGGYGVAPGNFSNLYVDIGDLSILTCHSKFGLTYTAIDLSGVANAQLRDGQTSTTGVVAPPAGSYVSPNVFATGLSIGILLPANGNNDCTILRNWTIGGGYTYGLLATEHTDIYGLRILYCWAALCPVGTYYSSVGAAHSINGSLISIEQCTYLVYVFGPGTGGLGPTVYLKIDTETSTPRFGDRTSGTGLAAARGEVVLAGLFTAAGLTLDNPTGLKIRNSQLTYPITTKTSNYTATSFDEHILADATSGAITITLPTAVGRTDPITVKKIDSSVNAVTIDGAGSETIDGQLTRRLDNQWDYATLVPSGSGWYIKAAPTATSWAERPSEQGLLTWTYDPNMAGHVTAQSNAGVAGRITLVKIPIREPITWSSIWFGLSGVDAGASLANCYLGVYDAAGNLKGTTADISSSLMSGATAKAVSLVTPFTAAPGTYFIAMLLNGTWTTNSLTFKASGAGVSVNAGLTAPNLRYSNLLTSQTSLPSSLTLSSQSTSIINTGWASQWYGVS
ncbi:hypothetical protein ACFXA3_00265 [Streptomyces sp. NPDC059456]|uniref:hypothetical protein n=1 Tax=Streptomyces sp. NPDC059456 TaxID=3346838 RepID=UPI0036886137